MESRDRFVVPHATRAAVERTLLAHRAEPDADWSSYHLAAVSAGGESVGVRATVQLQQRGSDVAVDATYRLTAWPLSNRRPWFRVAVLDARRLLRQALGAPAEQVDPAETDAVIGTAVAARRRFLTRALRVRIVCGVAALALSIVSLALGHQAHGRTPPRPAGTEYDSKALENQLLFLYGIRDAVCNRHHTLHISHLGQQVTCTADQAVYQVTITALDPFGYDLVRVG